MSPENDKALVGKYGEKRAARYLALRGCRILRRNLRVGKREVDILAAKGGTLIFTEVKTRCDLPDGAPYGAPADAVNAEKQRLLREAAQGYVRSLERIPPVRFDVVEVYLTRRASPFNRLFPFRTKRINHIKNAF